MTDAHQGGRRAPSTGGVKTVAAALFATVVVFLWTLPTTLYCWEGAYNVSLGDPPNWTFVAVLVVMGLVPWGFAAAYIVAMRHRHSMASVITFGALVLATVTVPVLFLRIMFAAPFF